jgi:uncharacterized BrkB/YihY/UPF0761 family membrane protein
MASGRQSGFRPAFRYYNKWVSLFGGVISIVIMFVLSYIYALVTFACLLFIYVYLTYHKPGKAGCEPLRHVQSPHMQKQTGATRQARMTIGRHCVRFSAYKTLRDT